MTTNRQAHSEAMVNETRDSAVLADRSVQLRHIDAAIAAEADDGARGALLLDRAIAQQGESDPSNPISDSAHAFELLASSGRTGEAALAAAVTGAMMQRAGDVEAAVDYAVEAMALVDIAERTLVVARAANSLATLFAQLSAFEQAFTYSILAADICAEFDGPTPMAISYTTCYVSVEANHAGVLVPLDRARKFAERLSNESNPIARSLLGPGMAAELSYLDHPERSDRMELDHSEIDQAAPRLQAWYRFVLAAGAHRVGADAEAINLLDAALPPLITLGDEHRVVRAYRLRSEVRAALGDMSGALDDAYAVTDTIRGWQIDQVGRLAVQISRRVELEQMKSSMQRRAVDLVRQINIDELTGTGSRRLLDARLDELEGQTGSVSVLVVDIDQFKAVNDDHGHAAGDAVLKRIGEVLRTTQRENTVLARYGGDEFVAVFAESGTAEAAAFADEAMSALSQIDWSDISAGLDIHVSAGVAAGESVDVRGVVERADAALYSAKRRGRNRCVIA